MMEWIILAYIIKKILDRRLRTISEDEFKRIENQYGNRLS